MKGQDLGVFAWASGGGAGLPARPLQSSFCGGLGYAQTVAGTRGEGGRGGRAGTVIAPWQSLLLSADGPSFLSLGFPGSGTDAESLRAPSSHIPGRQLLYHTGEDKGLERDR